MKRSTALQEMMGSLQYLVLLIPTSHCSNLFHINIAFAFYKTTALLHGQADFWHQRVALCQECASWQTTLKLHVFQAGQRQEYNPTRSCKLERPNTRSTSACHYPLSTEGLPDSEITELLKWRTSARRHQLPFFKKSGVHLSKPLLNLTSHLKMTLNVFRSQWNLWNANDEHH